MPLFMSQIDHHDCCLVTHYFTQTMQPATSQQRVRKDRQTEDPIDPYELVRRLSIIQAEEMVKELERRRADWETELRESRGVHQTQIRTRTHTSNGQPQVPHHRRSASISLAPDQLPPPAYTDLPEPTRKPSLPSFSRTQNPGGSRRPSLRRGDSGELATIKENVVVEPTFENLFPQWTEKERRRASVLPRVNEDLVPEVETGLWKARRQSSTTQGPQQDDSQPASQSMPRRRSSATAPCSALPSVSDTAWIPEATSDEWIPRRRLSATSQADSDQQDNLNSGGQSVTRRSSAASAQMVPKKLDESESNESGRTKSRKASLLDKIEHYWKPGKVDPRDADPFDSRASTLRNSWRSSQGDPTASRRLSMLKTIGDYWFIDPPSSNGHPRETDIHADGNNSVGDSTISKRRTSLLSTSQH